MTKTVNTIPMDEFLEKASSLNSTIMGGHNIANYGFMDAEYGNTTNDKDLYTEQHNRISDLITYTASSPSANDVTIMMLNIITRYPIVFASTDYCDSRGYGNDMRMAADGQSILLNPVFSAQVPDTDLMGIVIHELGHILLDDVSQHKHLSELLNNKVYADSDRLIPTIVNNLCNAFIDPIVNRIAIDAGANCRDINGGFVADHYDMCVRRVQSFIDVAINTGAVCDSPTHMQYFSNSYAGLCSMYTDLSECSIVSVTSQDTGLVMEKWKLLVSAAQLISRAIEIDDSCFNSGAINIPAGIGDVVDNEQVTTTDASSKREAVVNFACSAAGIDPGNWGLNIPVPEESNRLDELLPNVLAELLGGEDSYASIDPAPAAMGAFLPVDNSTKAHIGVAFDVSGSVVYSQEEFSLLLGELVTALNNPHIEKITLVLFDYGAIRLENVYHLEPGEDIQAIMSTATGGGGTEFDTPVKWLVDYATEEESTLTAIIMLTDGCARFNEQHLDIDRIWVSTSMPTEELDPSAQHIMLTGRRR